MSTCLILGVAQAAEAQMPRLFVMQSTDLFEVREGIGAGGRFVAAPTHEVVNVRGVGHLSVRGYTGHAPRRERVVAYATGSVTGVIEVTHETQNGRSFHVVTPTRIPLSCVASPIRIPGEPNCDRPTARLTIGSHPYTRKLPLRTRA